MRTILPSAKEFLSNPNNKIRMANLLMLELPSSGSSQFVYFTDYHKDIIYNGIPYIAGKLKKVSSNKQDRKLTVGSITFSITGADKDEVIRLVQEGVSFIDRKVIIYQALITDTGDILPVDSQTNGPMIFFAGRVTAGSIKDSSSGKEGSTSSITWSCSNMFYDFERVNGRMTDDASHRGLEVKDGKLVPSSSAKRLEYQEDLGFFHANQSVSILAQYQVKELRYKMKKKKKFFGLSSSYSMVEYYETVTKEVDIDFNLTAKYIPVVYGVQDIPGIPVFADTENNNPNIVYIVYAFCEGEIDGFLDFSFGDIPMICYDDADSKDRTCFGRKKEFGDTMHRLASGQSTSQPSVHGQEYKYNDGNGDIRVWTFHGKKDQTVATVLKDMAAKKGFYLQNQKGLGPEYWNNKFTLLDTAYAVVRYTITENRTDIPQLSATVQGRKVRVYDSSGKVSMDSTSRNGGWQLLDYLTSTTFGANVPINEVSIDQLIETAKLQDLQDESYESSWCAYWRYLGWKDRAQSNRQIIQLNTILDTADTVFKNVESILESFSGAINNLMGEYRVTMEKYDKNPIKVHFLETTGDIELQDVTGKNKYNSVQASIIDPAKGWKSSTITFYNSEFKKQDKGVDKALNLSFAYVTNYYCGRSMAARELKKSRYSRELRLTLPINFLGLEVNDAIAFTYDRYNWVNKYFLVDTVEISTSATIKVVLKEYGEDVFINSQQVEVDTGEIPSIETLVTPPRSVSYVPVIKGQEAPVGKNGHIQWLPSTTSGVIYYTIHQSDRLDPYIVNQTGNDMDSFLKLDLFNLEKGTYVFEVRAVDLNGRRSSPVVITVDINAAVNLSKVMDFKLVNRAPGSFTEWIGPDITTEWTRVPEENSITGLYYRFQMLHPTSLEILYEGKTTNGNKHIVTFAQNKAAFQVREKRLGVYREATVRVKAEGSSGESSIAWTYIDD